MREDIVTILGEFWKDLKTHTPDECMIKAIKKWEDIGKNYKSECRDEAVKELQEMLSRFRTKNPIL